MLSVSRFHIDVFLTVRRAKTTLFLSVKESMEVLELKKMIEGILKVPPEDQQLLRQSTPMDDHKPLAYYSLNSQTARAHSPATLGLCLRDAGKYNDKDVVIYCVISVSIAQA
ncbi:unnamed protein product [Schistocephalus solidus]|uniref:Ubiquitin-like domain-containing protein n=1 Tax=Schistocephalus solidus TaxID=70667 RepID=A0A183SZ57_SCHSO|nr:unnamed protein product [Schistocephalus solidus]